MAEGSPRLAELIDRDDLQALIDDLCRLTDIGGAVVDTSGAILASAGWRDICARYHRVHPVTKERCVESDLELSQGIEPGGHRLYRCRNGMWDMAAPVHVDGNHVGNVYLGQFFFDDEEVDRERFRRQAAECGFDEAGYLTALDDVPRWSRERAEAAMAFYSHLARMISDLGHREVELMDVLARQEAAVARIEDQRRQLTALADNSPDLIVRFDTALRQLYGNRTAAESTGLALADCVGLRPSEQPMPKEQARFMECALEETLTAGREKRVTQSFPTPDGTKWFETRIVPERAESGDILSLLAVSRDVTAAHQAEAELRESEARFRAYVESSPMAVFLVDRKSRIVDCNPAGAALSGYRKDELSALTFNDVLAPASKRRGVAFQRRLSRSGSSSANLQVVHRDGRERTAAIKARRLPDGTFVAYCSDVTEELSAREEERGRRRRAETEGRLLSELLAAHDEDEVLTSLVAAVGRLERGVNVVGCRVDEEAGTFQYGPHAGFGGKVRVALQLVGSDPRKATLRLDHLPSSVRESLPDGRLVCFPGEFHELSCGLVPTSVGRSIGRMLRVGQIYWIGLSWGGTLLGALAILVPMGRELAQVSAIEKAVHQAVLAIGRLRAEADAVEAATGLQRALDGTIDAMTSVIEMRDPYTAGHERRVTKLALAIAGHMELEDESRRLLRLAGSIHDVGKIGIPAEILSKPATLTENEMQLVRRHPQIGYDVLAGVQFDGPVAEIVLQHHERLDGSGYPAGLSGDEILPEARILAVADVVEAMASHRPYRPGLGVEAALEEIERSRGGLFDAAAVDACVTVIREGGFELPE